MIYGETSCGCQSLWLKNGCNILLATSGKLTDFAEIARGSNSQVQYLVLDIADRMRDMGFKYDIVKIVRNPAMPGKNSKGQMMLWAAVPNRIQKRVFNFLADEDLLLFTGHVDGACKDVNQRCNKPMSSTLIKDGDPIWCMHL